MAVGEHFVSGGCGDETESLRPKASQLPEPILLVYHEYNFLICMYDILV